MAQHPVAPTELLIRVTCHELRGPLGALRGLLHVVADPAADDATRTAALELARANVDQVALIVGLLADGALIAARAAPGATRPLGEVLAEAVRGRPRVLLRTVGGPPVDAVRVRRIVDNLLDNAIAHGPAGSQIVVEGTGAVDHAVVVVSDAGKLTADVAEALAAEEPPAGKRGLGLWIVKSLARQLDGSVMARNLRTGGLAVEVRLPCVAR